MRDETGISIIEVVVAALIVAVGLGFTLVSFIGPQKQTFGAQRQSQAAAIAEAQLESIAQRPWTTIGNTSFPTRVVDASDAPDDPRAHVRNSTSCGSPVAAGTTCLLVRKNFNKISDGRLTDTSSTGEPFVSAAHGLAPSATVQGATVHRFITWRDRDPCAPAIDNGGALDTALDSILGLLGGFTDAITNSVLGNRLNVLCLSAQSVKRVTVGVVLPAAANGAGPAKPVWMSAVVPNPGAGAFNQAGAKCLKLLLISLPVCTQY